MGAAKEAHMTISLDDVQHPVDQLSPLDQVRLTEHLSRQLAPALAAASPAPAPVHAEDAWAKLAQLREELAALPADRLASEQLSADRAERQATIEGAGRNLLRRHAIRRQRAIMRRVSHNVAPSGGAMSTARPPALNQALANVADS